MDCFTNIKKAMKKLSEETNSEKNLFALGDELKELEFKREKLYSKLGSLVYSDRTDMEIGEIKNKIQSIEVELSEKKNQRDTLEK